MKNINIPALISSIISVVLDLILIYLLVKSM